MDFLQSLLVALFCMGVVFATLIILWGIVSGFSAVLRKVTAKVPQTGKGE